MNISRAFHISLICLACNSAAPVQEQQAATVPDSGISYTEDTPPPAYDSLFTDSAESLDGQVQLQLFKTVMKGLKVKALYDFSTLENERILATFQNFHKTLKHYRDSSDKRYTVFFSDFYTKLEQHEQEIARPDTPDIRTKLLIARLKSDINSELASKKSAHLRP